MTTGTATKAGAFGPGFASDTDRELLLLLYLFI